MMKKEAEALRIFRLLTPEHQAALLALIRRAYREEYAPGNHRSIPVKVFLKEEKDEKETI